MIKKNEHKCKFDPQLDGHNHCECGNKVKVYDPETKKNVEQPLSSQIMALAEAAYPPTELQEKYFKLVEFAKSIANNQHYAMFTEDYLQIEARKGYLFAENILKSRTLLKKIGEYGEKPE